METTLAPENLTMTTNNANTIIGKDSSAYILNSDLWLSLNPTDGISGLMNIGHSGARSYGTLAVKFDNLEIAEAIAKAILQKVNEMRFAAANDPGSRFDDERQEQMAYDGAMMAAMAESNNGEVPADSPF